MAHSNQMNIHQFYSIKTTKFDPFMVETHCNLSSDKCKLRKNRNLWRLILDESVVSESILTFIIAKIRKFYFNIFFLKDLQQCHLGPFWVIHKYQICRIKIKLRLIKIATRSDFFQKYCFFVFLLKTCIDYYKIILRCCS
jgi:hypothetical protein